MKIKRVIPFVSPLPRLPYRSPDTRRVNRLRQAPLSLPRENGGFKGEGEIYTKEETIMGTNRTKSSEPREAIEHARMRYCVGATGAVAHAPTPTSAHNALWNKCVFIAAVAVAALLLKLAASSCCCCCRWLLLPPLFLFLQDARLSSSSPRFSCSARRERERERGAPSQMGPSDLHKAVLSSTHTATRWPLLLTVRARVSRTRVPFIKGAAHERAPRGHRSAAHALLR